MYLPFLPCVESSWNVMAHGDARKGKWRGNWRMEWVASTLHTTSEHGVSSITTADARTAAASSRLNWRPRRFKWTRLFRRKTKSGSCACAIAFQTQPTTFKFDVCVTVRLWYNNINSQLVTACCIKHRRCCLLVTWWPAGSIVGALYHKL